MKPPKQPQPSNPEPEFEEELLFLERSLVDLKERYTQVQRDRISKAEYEKHRQELNKNKHYTPEMKAELKHIKQQLEVLEVSLESQLFSWKSVKKPFWQIIRFGGLGVIIGWILKSYVG